MARKGDYFSINAQELGQAFAQAQEQKADYVVVLVYTPFSRPYQNGLGDANYNDTCEKVFSITRDTAASELAAMFKQHNSTAIKRVYDVATKQEGDTTLLPEGAYASAKQEADQAFAAAKRKTRPLWKRVFGI